MNALLEGDVARVGVVGIGAEPELRRARKRTRVGDVKLAPGRVLHTEHAFLDATRGPRRRRGRGRAGRPEGGRLHRGRGQRGVRRRRARAGARRSPRPRASAGCRSARATSSAAPTGWRRARSARRSTPRSCRSWSARRRSSRACCTRRASTCRCSSCAATAARCRSTASARARRSRSARAPRPGWRPPCTSSRSTDGIVLECGGTSSNVSVVKHGRTVLRTLRVMGRPTSLRSVDSWVVGAAGGSMARIGRRRVEETGPRSAHVAGLPYACFARRRGPRRRGAGAARAAPGRPRVRGAADRVGPARRADRDLRGARARPGRRRPRAPWRSRRSARWRSGCGARPSRRRAA